MGCSRRPATGCLATVAALLGASSALQKGNRTQFNMFLRYRVAAQGLTLIAALGTANSYRVPDGRQTRFKSADLVPPWVTVASPYRWIGVLWCPTKGATGSRSRSKSSSSCCLCITNPRMISSLPAIVLLVGHASVTLIVSFADVCPPQLTFVPPPVPTCSIFRLPPLEILSRQQ